MCNSTSVVATSAFSNSKPRDSKPRDSKPRDSKPRDSKPRDSEPRDSNPRDSPTANKCKSVFEACSMAVERCTARLLRNAVPHYCCATLHRSNTVLRNMLTKTALP
jgi:hypothetical protein